MKNNLKVAFIDTIGFSYDHDVADNYPIGGTQALVAILLYYLSKNSNNIELFLYTVGDHNYQKEKINFCGINKGINHADIFIILNNIQEKNCIFFKEKFPLSKLIFWSHANLINENNRNIINSYFDKVVFVSKYSNQKNKKYFSANKMNVIKNFLTFMPYVFENYSDKTFEDQYDKKIDYAYLGGLTRGFEYLGEIADEINKFNLEGKLKVFTGMSLYNPFKKISEEQEHSLILKLRKHPLVNCVKKIAKKNMYKELLSCKFLISPNTFNESFCMSVIEAMFYGLTVISTNRSAIPETVQNFGNLLKLDNATTDEKFSNFNIVLYMDLLRDVINKKSDFLKIKSQREFVIKNYSPHQAALNWVGLFEELSN